ncbi:hypothetical protein ACFQAV_05590 [Companilactobacillus huachuanensis]|uniref:Uncharacterized protein n=1 Tax=Companilactobacillus huachuanensis TaxID=2559914 RepID=A0ABW1RJP6_9LACO|nr:hypothetical protein [Companilactobacillus huachuanensis]
MKINFFKNHIVYFIFQSIAFILTGNMLLMQRTHKNYSLQGTTLAIILIIISIPVDIFFYDYLPYRKNKFKE